MFHPYIITHYNITHPHHPLCVFMVKRNEKNHDSPISLQQHFPKRMVNQHWAVANFRPREASFDSKRITPSKNKKGTSRLESQESNSKWINNWTYPSLYNYSKFHSILMVQIKPALVTHFVRRLRSKHSRREATLETLATLRWCPGTSSLRVGELPQSSFSPIVFVGLICWKYTAKKI